MVRKKRNNRIIRILPFLLAFLLAAGCLSACSRREEKGQTSSASEPAGTGSVSVSEASSEPEEKQETALPADLEELQQGIEEYAFTPEMEALTGEERVEKIAAYLQEMEASGLIEEGSVIPYPDMELVAFRQTDGCLVFVDFREREPGTYGSTAGAASSFPAETAVSFYPGSIFREPETRKITPSGRSRAKVSLFTATDSSVVTSLNRYSALQKLFDASPELDGEVVLATPDRMRTGLKGLDMAILELHGTLYPIEGKSMPCLQVYTETIDMAADPLRMEDFLGNRMAAYMGMNPDTGKTSMVFLITPYFFEHYYGAGGLLGMIVHLGSCHAFGDATASEPYGDNYILSDALLDCGAEAVVGHHNAVYMDYDDALVLTEVEYLRDANTLDDGLQAALRLYGDNDKIFVEEHWDSNTTDNFETHVPSHTSIRGNKDAVLFLETEANVPQPTPEPGADPTPTEEPFEVLHPEAPETPGGTVPDTSEEANWRAAYARILAGRPESAKFVLTYVDYDLIPELFVAEGGSHVDAVDIYTYKNSSVGFLGSIGSFGTAKVVPYENFLVSEVEYFGTKDTASYTIDGFSLTLAKTLFTNENNTMEGVETVYQVNGADVTKSEYDSAASGIFDRDGLVEIGYGTGYANTPANQAAFKNGEKKFTLTLG